MCTKLNTGILAKIRQAKEKGDTQTIKNLMKELDEGTVNMLEKEFVSGYDHPELYVTPNLHPKKVQVMTWGLIPPGISDFQKAQELRQNLLIARSETMFEKWSFATCAKTQRCIIHLDSFFEYCHENGKKNAYKIELKSNTPMAVAGLWNIWTDWTTQKVYKTACMITTEPPIGHLMRTIHNSPANSKTSRMPVILPQEVQDQWLFTKTGDGNSNGIQDLMNLCVPLEDSLLTACRVDNKTGKFLDDEIDGDRKDGKEDQLALFL